MPVLKPLSHYKNTKVLLLILTCSGPCFTVLLMCFMLHDIVQVDPDCLRSRVSDLLHALVCCFKDDSWPVRDGELFPCFPVSLVPFIPLVALLPCFPCALVALVLCCPVPHSLVPLVALFFCSPCSLVPLVACSSVPLFPCFPCSPVLFVPFFPFSPVPLVPLLSRSVCSSNCYVPMFPLFPFSPVLFVPLIAMFPCSPFLPFFLFL